jgi:outer membrane protein TolC
VIASIPLFNHAEQQARETQVLAQVEPAAKPGLTQVERDIEADLWRNARLLETETQNLKAAKMLLRAATQSYQITFGRYKAGVGSILELISTQDGTVQRPLPADAGPTGPLPGAVAPGSGLRPDSDHQIENGSAMKEGP